jgi:UDP-N-acetylmuramoyl-L-alanyl-D-glutamate--2,6-diaminopimelate ligase
LGALAGQLADIVIVTNEDPYDDDPKLIIDQVAAGVLNVGKALGKNLFKIEERRQAIGRALSMAGSGDIVFITGKGCEQAICLAGGVKMPWDDRRAVREELERITAHNV